MNKKMRDAIKSGQLIPLKKVMDELSVRQRKEIDKQVRYIRTAMAVRRLRKQLKLTQEKLAKKMKVKRELIARIESGRQNVTLKTLYQIAEATGKEITFKFK